MRWKSPTSRCSIASGSRRSCSTPATDVHPAEGPRAQPIDDFVFGIGLFNADGVCCYGTNTYLEEMDSGAARRRRPKRRSRSTASISSKALTSSTSRCTSATVSLRLPPSALHVPREIADSTTSAFTGRATDGRSRRTSCIQTVTGDSAAWTRRRRPAACVARAARRRQDRSCSPTACSICSTSVTCATCSRPGALGDALLVGINSDRSVRAHQGGGPADHRRSRSGPRSSRRSRASTRS